VLEKEEGVVFEFNVNYNYVLPLDEEKSLTSNDCNLLIYLIFWWLEKVCNPLQYLL